MNCTKKVIFRCGKVGGGRGVYGVSERGGWVEFRAITAWGEKLLSSLADRALMLRYRLPDGRSWKRLWEGWVGSFTILLALLEHRVRKISSMEGRGAPMIFYSCVHCLLEGLAVCCTTVSVPDNYAAGQHALNGYPVESGEDGWRETCSFLGAVVPSWRVTWCWWSRGDSLWCAPPVSAMGW